MRNAFFLLVALTFLAGCNNRHTERGEKLTSIQTVDRNGFKETVSAVDRLALYEKTNFLAPQPYEKVVRMFGRSENGKTLSKLTTYHDNGQIWQYLEVVNGRACGTYREWHENGTLRLDVMVVEGLGDLCEQAMNEWVFDGVSRAWDSSGCLLAKIHYEKGILQGKSLFYHPNGAISKMIPYENGRIDGEILHYDEKEAIIGKTPYRAGRRHGIATFKGNAKQPAYSEEYQEDRLVQASYHNFSGKLIAQVEEGYGKQTVYVDGRLHSIHEYREGVPEGEVQIFSSTGQLTTLFHVKKGMKHGEEWVYYSSLTDHEPQPKLYVEWYEDRIQGICRSWYPNGVLESEREIRDNKKQGICSAWYKDGSLMLVEEYENDLLHSGSYLKRGELRPISSIENGQGTATLYDADGFFIKRALYEKGRPIDEL